MTLRLEPTDHLGTASDRMSDLADSTKKVNAFIESNPGALEQSDGRMFFIGLRNHDSACSTAGKNVDRSRTLLAGVSNNLNTAQTRYDQTEDDNSVAVDDIFAALEGSGDGGPLQDRGSGSTFGTGLPANDLGTPQEFQGIPEWAQIMVELGGSLVSPTYWLTKVLQWTVGINPLDWFIEQFTGDWQGVSKAGDAFDRVGKYWQEMSSTLADDAGVLFRGWQGDAANSAQSYFQGLYEAFGDQAPALIKLGGDYKGMGGSMYFAAKGCSALIGLLLDLAFGAAILAAAIYIATQSVVGAPAAAAMAAQLMVLLEAMLGVWNTVLTVQGAAVGGAYLFAGLVGGYLSTVHPVDQVRMPSEA